MVRGQAQARNCALNEDFPFLVASATRLLQRLGFSHPLLSSHCRVVFACMGVLSVDSVQRRARPLALPPASVPDQTAVRGEKSTA